jgi:hypothetical protein
MRNLWVEGRGFFFVCPPTPLGLGKHGCALGPLDISEARRRKEIFRWTPLQSAAVVVVVAQLGKAESGGAGGKLVPAGVKEH